METALNPVGTKATQLLDVTTTDAIARACASAEKLCSATRTIGTVQDLGRVIKQRFNFLDCAVY
jgi:hypothetical protein